MSAGAEDVVDHVAGGAGGPLLQSVGPAVRPAGNNLDYVLLSRNLHIHYVHLSQNLHIHYVQTSTSFCFWLVS